MVRQKKILFVLCTHSLIVIVVHAQSVMTLGLGGGSIVFPGEDGIRTHDLLTASHKIAITID